jgi:iron complex outermembrane receptor protein
LCHSGSVEQPEERDTTSKLLDRALGGVAAVTTSSLTQGSNILTVASSLYQRQVAAFGELTYTLFGKLDLTAGIRQFNFRTEDDATGSGLLEGGTAVENVSSDQTSHVLKYRVAYHLTNDNLLYAQAAQGFRVGGGLGGFNSEDAVELKALGYATPPTQYQSDTFWNYELGSKNSFFEGRFSVSGDIYYIDWKNIQIAVNLPDGNQFIANAARAASKGAELEAQVNPVAGLELNVSGAYTNATYGDTSAASETVAGGSLPNVPRWTYSLSGTYTHVIASGYDGYLRADLRHIDSRFNDLPGNTAGLVNQPSYTLLNLRLGFMHDGWGAALFVDNLANKVAILNTQFIGALEYQTINTPRTVGLNVKKRF